MTEQMATKLERLKNYHTRYEVVAEKDGRKILLGYTARVSRQGLWGFISSNAAKWCVFANTQDARFRKKASEGLDSGGWHVHFSGRTQREAILGIK
jgi:hypothetical protein